MENVARHSLSAFILYRRMFVDGNRKPRRLLFLKRGQGCFRLALTKPEASDRSWAGPTVKMIVTACATGGVTAHSQRGSKTFWGRVMGIYCICAVCC